MTDQFPLSLKEVLFTSMHIEAIPAHNPNEFVPNVIVSDSKLNVTKIDPIEGSDSHEYNVAMRVVHNPERDPRSPYYFDFECIAFIEDISKGQDPTAERRVHISGHSVVYGAIRESLLWLSSRSVFGPFSLGFSILSPNSLPPVKTLASADSTPPDSPASPSS